MSNGPVTGVDVYLCDCGPILQELLDIEEIARRLGESDPEVRCHRHPTLCSPEGRAWLSATMGESSRDRMVIAACSPREHEATFRQAAIEAGRNPYLLAVANLREQCGWVCSGPAEATPKAILLIRAAIARVRQQVPMERREVEASSNVVVVGAGIAGLTAARLLAHAGREVTLLERDPVIGGRAARLSDLFPHLECASCALEPLLDEVLHHPGITLVTCCEVEEIVGSFGRFRLTVRKRARFVDPEVCLGMQCCSEVCPVEVPNEWEEGLTGRKAIFIPYRGALPHVSTIDPQACRKLLDGSCEACVAACPFGAIDFHRQDEVLSIEAGAVVLATGAAWRTPVASETVLSAPAVFTTMAMERMFSSAGCTDGEVRLADGSSPVAVLLLHCVDAAGAAPCEPCSKICCMTLAKHARMLREKLPQAEISTIAWDRSYGGKGFREFSHRALAAAGAREIRLREGDRLWLEADGERVAVRFAGGDREPMEGFDMVIVAPPLAAASGVDRLAEELRLERDAHGFLAELHERMGSFASRVDGVYLAGSVQGPKDLEEASTHGAAAAASALASLVPGRKLQIEPTRAGIEETVCGGCRICPSVCPFRAITFDPERRVATVNDLLCRGCGACAVACPAAAIAARGFTDDELRAEIEALLDPLA